MLTATSIAEALTAQDATNGWDAAYGMNLRQVNALFLQQFLDRHVKTDATTHLRVVLSVQPAYWILEADLGPPKLSFRPDSQNASLEMEMVRGALIAFDPSRQLIQSVGRIRPLESRLTGPMSLQKTKGDVNEVGKVVADLGASAYTPKITGVDPQSVLQTDIGLAVQTYFAANQSSYPLGALGIGQVPDCLRPTSFHFVVQRRTPTSDDACVLLLIRTNGAEGTIGPLAAYPIPDGHTAALIVGKAVLGRLLVNSLTEGFQSLRLKFEYQPNGASWRVACSSGDLDFGQFGNEGRHDGDFWSSDDRGNAKSVRIPLAGFKVEPGQNMITASWTPRHTQHWTLHREWVDFNENLQINDFILKSVLSPAFRQSGPPSVDPISAVVTFGGTGEFSLNADGDPKFWDEIFNRVIAVPDAIRNRLRDTIGPPFRSFHLPNVDAFALGNLLFPAQHAVSFKEAKLPGDLYLTGSLAQRIAVTPPDVAVSSGKTVQFTATSFTEKEVFWQITPKNFGSISSTGLYTAPSKVDQARVVIVSAISRANGGLSGGAMALVYPPPASTGVAVSPNLARVTAGQTIELTTTNRGGELVDVKWSLSPDLGHVKTGWSHGKYNYTAPDSVTTAVEVRATATNAKNPAETGVAVISLSPVVKVSVSPDHADVKLGGKLELRAEAAGVDPENIRWAVFPTSGGTITPHDEGNKAAYHAPSAVEGGDFDVKVIAYTIDDDAGVGLGFSDITLVK
jgi:hypothetical protein